MVNRIKKYSVIFLILQLFTTALFAQDAVSKALELLNKSLILNDSEKAYSYAKFVINYYEDDELPSDAETAVKNAVAAYSKNLEEKEMWSTLKDLEEELASTPAVVRKAASPSIKKAKEYFNRLEEEKNQKKEEEKRLVEEVKRNESSIESEKLLKLFEQQEAQAQRQMELEKQRQEQELKYRTELSGVIKEMNAASSAAINNASSSNRFMVIGFGVLILIFVGVIVFVIVLGMKQQQINQEQMKSTLLSMQAMRIAPSLTAQEMPLPLQITSMSEGDKKPLLIAGNSDSTEAEVAQTDSAQPAQNTDIDTEKMNALLKACKSYGEQIDAATGRKNVSERVAELVYKVSKKLGFSETESMLYYAASLVYDIGFLGIDNSILRSTTLTAAQFEMVKTHTTIGANMVFFVDEQYRSLFKDASGKHHENMDGSGYPSGLKGNQIPYIARALRVVESYVALISNREYRQIHDRNAAIEELKSVSPKNYDQQIVEALDEIV